jgi:HYR domain
MRLFRKATLVIALATFAASSATVADAGSERASGLLDLRAELRLTSNLGGCPPPSGASECAARTGAGLISGLGTVTESYEFPVGLGPPSCPPGLGQALETTLRFVVAGKGEIHFALAKGGCIAQVEPIYNQIQGYTITGGTGLYAGASGSGTVGRRLGDTTATGRHGREIWTGTLDVPGLEFDTTRPTLNGATSKTVRAAKDAKTTRVRFTVTAQDDRDGAVPVRCTPRSGSRFRIGRTKVTCEATDGSANTAAASFTVTVRASK